MFATEDLKLNNNNASSLGKNQKDRNKDFGLILEGKKDRVSQSEKLNKKQGNKTNKAANKKDLYKRTKVDKSTGENSPDDLVDLEDEEEEIRLVLLNFYNLLEDLDLNIDLDKIKSFIDATGELDGDKLLDLLAELENMDLPIVQGSLFLEVDDRLEGLVSLLEHRLGKEIKETDKKDVLISDDKEVEMVEVVEIDGELSETKTNEKSETGQLFLVNDEETKVDKQAVNRTGAQEAKGDKKISIDISKEKVSKEETIQDLPLPTKEEVLVENGIDLFSFEANNRFLIGQNELGEMPSIEDLKPQELLEQIVESVKVAIDDFKQEIKISLKPEILGELIVKMQMERGSLLARIMVDNYKTKELVEANLYQLRQEMEDNGLEIKTFEVFVGTNEDFHKEKGQEYYPRQQKGKEKIKDKTIKDIAKDIQAYDNNVFERRENTLDVGKLNLLA